MKFSHIMRAVDALISFSDAAKRFRARNPESVDVAQTPSAGPSGLAGQIEARLTNVVVAALKEAFDRDHARLELERTHLEEERRRAEAALHAELRRQVVDRELGRLRLIAAAAMVGWIASVAILAAGFVGQGSAARVVMVLAWLLLLGALGAAFTAQGRVGVLRAGADRDVRPDSLGTVALSLLLCGLAATAISLLL